MAYKKQDLIDQSIQAIAENDLIYIEEIFAFVPFSKKTFYNYRLHELPVIQKTIADSVIKQKTNLRREFAKSKNATERVVLYKLLATEAEFQRIATNHIDHTSKGEKIAPLSIQVTKDENKERYEKHLEKLAKLN